MGAGLHKGLCSRLDVHISLWRYSIQDISLLTLILITGMCKHLTLDVPRLAGVYRFEMPQVATKVAVLLSTTWIKSLWTSKPSNLLVQRTSEIQFFFCETRYYRTHSICIQTVDLELTCPKDSRAWTFLSHLVPPVDVWKLVSYLASFPLLRAFTVTLKTCNNSK